MSNQLLQTAPPSDNSFSSFKLLLAGIDQNQPAVENRVVSSDGDSSDEGSNPCVQDVEFSSDEEMEVVQPIPGPAAAAVPQDLPETVGR